MIFSFGETRRSCVYRGTTSWSLRLRQLSLSRLESPSYSSKPLPIRSPSKLICQITRRTWYSSCMLTPPARPVSVAIDRMLVPPFASVEDSASLRPLRPAPAAARKMSTKGSKVSRLCFQYSSLDFLVPSVLEYCLTAISCKPESELLASVERYVLSLGSASSSGGEALVEALKALSIILDRTSEVRRGIGSSGFEDCERKGRNGLYGFECRIRLSANGALSVMMVSLHANLTESNSHLQLDRSSRRGDTVLCLAALQRLEICFESAHRPRTES